MNETSETALAAIEVVTPPLWRVQLIRILQILGTAAAAVGSFDLTPWSALLDPKLAAALIAGGAFARMEAPQIINFIGDLTDNGKLDGSFKNGLGRISAIIIGLFFAFSALMLASCGGLALNPPDPQGCFLLSQSKGGNSYSVGPCADAQGKIYAYRTLWTNADGVKLRATYTLATKSTLIQYSTDGGITWLGWSSKAGISLDGLPPESQPTVDVLQYENFPHSNRTQIVRV
jgi:hypothetical protein